jgi:hypothetical protein
MSFQEKDEDKEVVSYYRYNQGGKHDDRKITKEKKTRDLPRQKWWTEMYGS